MPRISDARRRQRRAQILDAARGCFLQKGLHPTTMDDIIRAAGLSAGAVYGYFATKDDLILAAIDETMTRLTERMRPILAPPGPPGPSALLRAVGQAIDGLAAEDGVDLKRIALLGWAEAQRDDRVRQTLRRHYGGLRLALVALATRWRAQGLLAHGADPGAAANALLSLARGYVAQAALLGGIDPDAAADGLAALLAPDAP